MAAGTDRLPDERLRALDLLAAALGNPLHADIFTIANTVPNMLYILLAGGIFNAVLVPQLVRAMKNDADGGEAYTNRMVTLAALFLAGDDRCWSSRRPAHVGSSSTTSGTTRRWPRSATRSIDFARLCLPQVFFYGMFVLVGQMLNSRGRFGPMMWAPIANNVVAMAVLVIYLGRLRRGQRHLGGGYTAARSCCSASARPSASRCSS